MGLALALGTELSALIVGGYYASEQISKQMQWDANLVMAFSMGLILVLWFAHVLYIFREPPSDGDDISSRSQ